MRFFNRFQKKLNFNPIDIEETFLDDLLKKKERDPELLERKIESPLKQTIFSLFLVFGVFVLFFLLASSFNLQVLNYEKYKNLSEKNKFLDLKIRAERGVIYDRNMVQLVSNVPRFDLFLEISKFPQEEKRKDEILREISEIIDVPFDDLERKINESSGDLVLLKENLEREDLILIETKINSFTGIKIKKQIRRDYIEEESLSHILGYLGIISPEEVKSLGENYEIEDYVGKEGLEKQYERVLAERKGTLEIERDVQGNVISQKIKENPCSGRSIVLTLDFDLQKKLSQTMRDILKGGEGKGAASVALDPRTGEVLASVSLPGFNNNLFARGITQEELKELNEDKRKPQLNRVIGGVYPVGSTIKPLVGIAALEERIINEETTFFCPLELCLKHKYSGELKCYSDWTFHGLTSIKKAIAESVNPFFYIIGGGYESYEGADPRLPESFEGLGSKKIADWLRKFGWGQKTGIDLPGEVQGRVPDAQWKEKYFSSFPREKQIWYLGDTYNLSIGQGYILTSPLQVAVAFQALANGGKIFKPRIVKEILPRDEECLLSQNSEEERLNGKIEEQGIKDGKSENREGELENELIETDRENAGEEFIAEILNENFVSPESIEIIREGMRQAVVSPSGSAVMLSTLPVEVAAKTGTAQVFPNKEIYHNWITVFAPYENPEILLVIMFENVEGTRIVAQKAAKEVLEWYFSGRENQN